MRTLYRIRGLWWRTCDIIIGRIPRCDHGFAPDQGIGLWCPACEYEERGEDDS